MRYSARLVEHFLHPRNAEGCGDLARIFIRVREGRAVEVRFQSYGCGPTIAAASAASELIGGRVVEELVSLKADEIERALDGLPDDRKHAAEVVAGAVRAAALDALRRRAA